VQRTGWPEQADGHKVLIARFHPYADKRHVTGKEQTEGQVCNLLEMITIYFFQGRAANNLRVYEVAPARGLQQSAREPAVAICQGHTLFHFFYIPGGMQMVTIQILHLQIPRERLPDRRFAASRNPHIRTSLTSRSERGCNSAVNIKNMSVYER